MHFVSSGRTASLAPCWARAMLGSRLVTTKVHSRSNVHSHSKIQGERRTASELGHAIKVHQGQPRAIRSNCSAHFQVTSTRLIDMP